MSQRRRRGFTVPNRVRLRESAATLNTTRATPVRIAEATDAAPVATGSRRFRARLIAGDVQGSSGFYPAAMLSESVNAGVWPAGLPVYLDHPTATEETDRPERSVRDLAGRLVTDAVYDGDGLYADIEVYPHYAPIIEAMADAIGMSIRASGTAEYGKPEGQRGPLITSITSAESVDFVTKAGAGGKIVALLESARRADLAEARNVGAWLESRLHLALTQLADDMYGNGRLTREERIALSSAIGDGLSAYTAKVTAEAPQLFQRDLYQDPEPVDADVTESRTPQTSDGDPPPAPENPSTQEEPSMSGAQTAGAAPGAQAGTTPTGTGAADVPRDLVVAEAQRQVAELQLNEARQQAEALRAQLTEAQQATALATARAERAEADLRQVRAREAAREAVTAELAKSDLPAFAHTKVVESVTRTVALDDKGEVDAAALNTAITAAIEAERNYIAEARQAAGEGTPTGLGTSAPTSFAESGAPGFDAGAFQNELTERFARLGMDDKSAALAARIA